MASTDTFHTVTSTTPSYRNITISNVTAVTLSGISRESSGVAGIARVQRHAVQGEFPDPYENLCVYNAQGVQIADSNLAAPNTSSNTFTLYNAQLTVTNSAANANLATVGGLASHVPIF